jgi:hypothetical protein
MKYLQYRFYDKRGEAPTRWFNNGTGNPSNDEAIRRLLEGKDFEAESLIVKYGDGSAVEFRFDPETT